MDILVQIVTGFGVRAPIKCTTSDDAMSVLKKNELDLIICEAQLEGMDGYDLVGWLRKSKLEPNCYASALIVSGHTPLSKFQKARDCGANFFLIKPLTPKALLDRIIWVARQDRSIIECETYVGPDRRFHSIGPPPDTEGRRHDDLPLEVGAASTPNLSQVDIDALMQPNRVSL